MDYVRAACAALGLAWGCSGEISGNAAGDASVSTPDAAAPREPDAAVDLCPQVECPVSPVEGVAEGAGLVAADPCQLELDGSGAGARLAIVADLETVLPRVRLADMLADANREGATVASAGVPDVTGFTRGFTWNDGDQAVTYWMPQGVSGSGDAIDTGLFDGREVLVVTWYYKEDDPGAPSTVDRGVRVSFIDLGVEPPRYRHALLVEPVVDAGRPDFDAVPIHAGGVVWIDRWLWVVDTSRGFRVFDLDHVLAVDASGDDGIGWDDTTGAYEAWGYAYAIPQVAAYELTEGSCRAAFSFVSLDRSTTPPSLLSGEYDADAHDGRLFRWPLAPDGLLASMRPLEAWHAGQTRIQGAATWEGQTFLSCSSQVDSNGRLYRATPGAPSVGFGWPRGPEDLSIWPTTRELWTLTELAGARTVFAIDLDSVLPASP